jgi:hypothetical protein
MRDMLIQLLTDLNNPSGIVTQTFVGQFATVQTVLKSHMPDDGSKELMQAVFDSVWNKYMAERRTK